MEQNLSSLVLAYTKMTEIQYNIENLRTQSESLKDTSPERAAYLRDYAMEVELRLMPTYEKTKQCIHSLQFILKKINGCIESVLH